MSMKSAGTLLKATTLFALVLSASTSVFAIEVPADAGTSWRGPDGSTALQWAVYNGDLAKVKQLLKQGSDVAAVNNYGANAMQLAAEVADPAMLKLLLDAGANADSPNPEGQTALMLVARTGNVEAAKLLVSHKATVDAREQFGQQTALMWATARHHPEMMQYLIEKGADVNARSIARDYQRHLTAESRAKNLDSGGLTPLLYAIREDCTACVRLLLDKKADVNLPDPDGVSPLLLSILNSNWDISRVLLEAGADVDQWDIYGQSPLYAVAGRAGVGGGGGGGAFGRGGGASSSKLNVASGSDILKMLIDRGANVNMQLFMRPAKQRGGGTSRGTTPLHNAVGSGDLETVKLLIAHGADVNLNDGDNESALMLTMESRNEQTGLLIMEELHKAGMDPNANALYHHLQRTRGGTALHYAVRAGWKRAIDKLVEYKIDLNIKDPDGLTALDYAMARGYIPFLQMRQPPRKDIAEQLRKAGATVELEKEPFWIPVGPPIGYEATIWPL
jgi:ankyrin repeat protein